MKFPIVAQIKTGQNTSIQKRERNCPFPSRESVVAETVQCRTRTPGRPPRLPPLTPQRSLLVNGGGPRNASRAPVRQQSKHAGQRTHTRCCPALRAAETPTPETALNSRNLLQPVSPTLCETFKVSGSQLCLSSQMWAD